MAKSENDPIAVEFGKLLRKRRKEVGISQDKLAEIAEIDRSYVGRIERGEVNVTLKMVYTLSTFLECSPKDLLP